MEKLAVAGTRITQSCLKGGEDDRSMEEYVGRMNKAILIGYDILVLRRVGLHKPTTLVAHGDEMQREFKIGRKVQILELKRP